MLTLFSKSSPTGSRSKADAAFSVGFIPLGSICPSACGLAGLPLDTQVSEKLELPGSLLLHFSAASSGDGSSEMPGSGTDRLYSGLVSQSERKKKMLNSLNRGEKTLKMLLWE